MRPRSANPRSLACGSLHLTMVAKGHRLDSRQREASISQLLTAGSKLLRCPQVEENAPREPDHCSFGFTVGED
jgi:hypothetical protein